MDGHLLNDEVLSFKESGFITGESFIIRYPGQWKEAESELVLVLTLNP